MDELSEQMQIAMDNLAGCSASDKIISDVMFYAADVLLAYGRLLIEAKLFDKAHRALDTGNAIMDVLKRVREA